MGLALLTLIPVGLGLFLLAFGAPERPFLSPTPRNGAAVAAGAVALGPVAMLVLGFGGWLVLIAVLVAALLIAVGLRSPGDGALQE